MEAQDKPSVVETQKLLDAFARNACEKLFEAYGLTLRETDPNACLDDKLLLTAVIGFTGPGLRASCILAATELPLRRSKPVPGPLRDWMAELGNQLVGRIKNDLLRHGTEVYVTTPVVIRGEHLAPPNGSSHPPQAFTAPEGGRVLLWLDAEPSPDFCLSRDPQDPPLSEGDTVLF
jgi:hypothetical protein